jgi:hypothetical protein
VRYFLAALIFILVLSPQASAEEEIWPKVAPGKAVVLKGYKSVPKVVVDAAREFESGISPDGSEFTFFSTTDGSQFVSIDASNPDESYAYLFQYFGNDHKLRPIPLTHGDPLYGFYAISDIGIIEVGPEPDIIRTDLRVDFCEQGHNKYQYKYRGGNEIGNFVLTKVVHVDCSGKERTLYKTK